MTRLSPRLRLAVLAVVLLTAAGGASGYVWQSRQRQPVVQAAGADAPPRADLAAVRAVPHVVFRNTELGPDYGRVAMVALAQPAASRAVTPVSCDRVYATRNDAVCVAAERGLVTTSRAHLLGPDWTPRRELPVVGLPSRARLSRDGSLVATTTFVHGDSYASPGQFSTRTVVTRADAEVVGDLERFDLVVDGRAVTAVDRNVWGVTFADDDRFFATAASGGKTWLVEGSLSARRLTALREDVECPSLSPDRTRIAFKRRGDLPAGRWQLAVYELASGTETLLAETRSVDDQVEWLDDRSVLYGLPRGRPGTASSDVWSVPADGRGTPALLIPDAWSPAVVR
ncbi:hypothetical protein [Micromonospora endophytica]|uniref:Uncharacterized protein n=1 Tax=Micromonospora endophytica TaxID=515350 RepID=A0A2W2DGX3_9ACTN|nr:hypothetical protein [Micromonospora endophytica]PZF96446.1 hypothetical protein C1I93_13880 [Micromonospora endophytica]RIW49950.1 hypothetical protein D3H59_04155 [Micromonospora endophytica]BCJ57092.1 TolB-like translocation protein; signal peptide [Micromonospora endophytica]